MKHVQRILCLAVVLISGSQMLAVEPASKPASQPATASAPAVKVDLTSPKALLQTLHDAAGADDDAAFAQCMEPSLREITKASNEMKRTVKHLFQTMDKKLGTDATKFKSSPAFAAGLGEIDVMAPAVVNGKIDWDKVQIARELNNSVPVSINGNPNVIKNIEGKYYLSTMMPLDATQSQIALLNHLKILVFLKQTSEKLEKGLNDGSLTKDNFEQAIKTIGEDSVSTTPK